MNSLDSRYLRAGDTFAHRFTISGPCHYTIGIPGGGAPRGHHAPFEISVAEAAGAVAKTHYVTVGLQDKRFTAEPACLAVMRNDAVLWSTAAAKTPGFAVQGSGAGGGFDSAALPANSMYSHAFGRTGVFEWSDAAEPRLHGRITVAAHPQCRGQEDHLAYAKKLAEPALVMIDHHRARPHELTLIVGQTVFFAIRNGAGVTIVERALLAANPVFLNPQPLPP